MAVDDEAWRRLDELNQLAVEQVVGVGAADDPHGSGFLVSDDTILTCAHVVQNCETVSVSVQGCMLEAEVVRMVPENGGDNHIYEFPDLAELRLCQPVHGIGVWLGEKGPSQGGKVAVHGFSHHTLQAGVQRDTLLLVVAGPAGEMVRLQGDQVVQGFSGAPVLDLRTGRVCGVLKASRDEQNPHGGWLIPVDAVRRHFPELAQRNDRAHRPGTPWCDVVLERSRRQVALFGRARPPAASRLTPAQMLAHNTMPFEDRPELGDLRAWCDDDPDYLLRLLHAPGGSGKTRLAAELCHEMHGAGWIAGFADKNVLGRPEWRGELTDALSAGIPVLVVFDYAQARLDDICAQLEHVERHGPERMRLRLLLLARSDEPLWQALQRRVDDWALTDASVVQLPRTIAAAGDTSLVSRAFTVFADRLGCGWLTAPESLDARAEKQDSLLGMLALALDAVLALKQGGTWVEADDPLERICDHEIRGWHALLAARLPGEGKLFGESGERLSEGLLLVPTLAPGLSSTDLNETLNRVYSAAFPGQQALNMFGVHTSLRILYPAGGDQVAPLEPDRIGEILVRRVLSTPESSGHTNAYLGALLQARHPTSETAQIAAAAATVEVLARARGCTGVGRVEVHAAHEALDAALGQAVVEHPEVLLPALVITGGVLPHAEPLADLMLPVLAVCEPPLLASVEDRLPDYPSSLSSVAVVVLGRLLDLPSTQFTEEDQLLRLRRLSRYSLRLDDTGRNNMALAPARQAVALSRDLVRQSGRHMAEYAAALNNLSLLLHRAGETGRALEQSRLAVDLYERLLAQAEGGSLQRQRYLLDTAAALSTLALLRREDGQVHAAAHEAAQGVLLCEQATPGARQDDTMLDCLEVLAECRQEIGLIEAAVVSGEESVALLRELAERQPGRYLARLPERLHSHARGLIRAGQYRNAYLAMREATNLRKGLPGGDSARLAAQRQSLRALAGLSCDLDEFSHERASWLEELKSLDDHGG